MGAVGALLGPKGVFMAFLATAIVGGIYAIGLLAFYGYLNEAVKRYWAILKTYLLTKKFIHVPPSKREEKPKLCYGVAIAHNRYSIKSFIVFGTVPEMEA